MLRIAQVSIFVLLCSPVFAQTQFKEKCPANTYDVVAPAIACPPNTTIEVDTTGTTILGEFAPVSAQDDCSVELTIMQSPVPCTILQTRDGSYLVTLVAIDNNHNAAACSFWVDVKLPE